MKKVSDLIVKLRIPILILAVILIIPSIYGMKHTRINYDMLTYLPSDMETVVGQDILLQDFHKGAFSLVILERMSSKEVSALEDQFKQVDHVDTVIWYDDIADTSIPMEILPDKYYDIFNSGNATMLAIFFDTSTSADETIEAVTQIRALAGDQCFVSGMSAGVTDLKLLCEKEESIYVGLAVLLACAAMMLLLDSYVLPFIFLSSIGMAILCNLGTNSMLGEVSYVTKAIAAVLQLGVTMDYSIFLWHSYCEKKQKYTNNGEAMAHAITSTITAVAGSSITTVAGFIALCFMSFTLGKDLGIVMAKGVLFGLIGCITTLPAMILTFDKLITKTSHKPLIGDTRRLAAYITKHAKVFLIIFVIVLIPAVYGYTHTQSYYKMSDSLPETLPFRIADKKLKDEFDVSTTHMLLVDSSVSAKQVKAMMDEMEDVDGVKYCVGLDSIVGSAVPEDFLPDDLVDALKSDRYQLILISSQYEVATDEVGNQITELNTILKKYDPNGMLIGEAPCTKDLITVTNHDFSVVDAISIVMIFVIIALTLASFSLPVVLVLVIEFAIFINLGIPYYMGVALPFIGPICISTIQLGSTVDYAILMTTRYEKERKRGLEKHEAVTTSLAVSIPSIIVSAVGFFAATFGVGLYSDIDIIGSMCNLMARGALISMASVIFILPAMLMLFDPITIRTTRGFKEVVKNSRMKHAATGSSECPTEAN